MTVTTGRTYGPNTAIVEALIRRAEVFTAAQCAALAAAWDTTDDTVWTMALDVAFDAAYEAGRTPAASAARRAALRAVGAPTMNGHSAGAAAAGAAIALVVRDLIAMNLFDTLYRPWADVVNTTEDTK